MNKRLVEADEHLLDLVHGGIQVGIGGGVHILEVPREDEQVFRLCRRPGGDADESCAVRIGESATAFGDVRRDRRAPASQLRLQPLPLLCRKPLGGPVYGQRQPVRLLPDLQPTEITHINLQASLTANG